MKRWTKQVMKLLAKSTPNTSNLYSTGISQWLKIKDVKKSRQVIENDPIIKDQMANLGCLFVCPFADYLSLVLIAAHTANNLDLGGEHEDEDYDYERP